MVELLERFGAIVHPVSVGIAGDIEKAKKLIADGAAGKLPPGLIGPEEALGELLLWSGAAGGNLQILRLALPIFNLPRDPRWWWMLWHPLFRSLECFKLVLQHCNPDASLYFGRTILHDIVGVYGRGPNRERQFANLSIQEGRLRRQAEKDPAELNAFQQPRIQATEARLNEAANLYIGTVRANRQEEFDPEALGFEFTLEQIEVRAIELQPDLFDDYWAAEKDCDRNDVAASPTA